MSTRDENGRFKKGNPGGPGRPARMIESDYLATLSEQVPSEAWATIVVDAVSRARNGDAKAREWLSRYLLPNDKGNNLLRLAAREAAGSGVGDEIREAANCLGAGPENREALDRVGSDEETTR